MTPKTARKLLKENGFVYDRRYGWINKDDMVKIGHTEPQSFGTNAVDAWDYYQDLVEQDKTCMPND